jgi:hypothetical protein
VGRLPSALDLARFQFAFTVVWHFLFPAFTIGLASYLAVLEGLWLATGARSSSRPSSGGCASSPSPSPWASSPAS